MVPWKQSLALALLAVGPVTCLFAADGLKPALDPRCKEIAARLKELKVAEVRVEVPTGPEPALANADPAKVEELVKKGLEKHGVKAVVRARYRLVLDYSEARRDGEGHLQPFAISFKLMEGDKEVPGGAFKSEVSGVFLLRRLNGTLPSPLSPALHELADEILANLEMKKEKSIGVNPLQGPQGDCHGLGKMLRDELVRRKTSKGQVRIDPGAALRLRGTYEIVPASDTASMRVELAMVDRLGKTLWSVKKLLPLSAGEAEQSEDPDGLRTLLNAVPVTATLPPDKPHAVRTRKMLEMIEKPSAHAGKDGWVSPEEKSPFAVAIRVAGKIRPATVRDGEAFVDLKKGEQYEVMVRSALPLDTAIALHVDTLSMFAFSENPNYTHVILPRGGKPAAIIGWHRTNLKSDRFQLMPIKDTPAAELIRTGDGIGTVCVAFSAAWAKDAPVPDDERVFKARRSRGEQLTTGRGPTDDARFKDVEKQVGMMRACVTIRYSREN